MCRGDVEVVVVAGPVDHPRLDERILAEGNLLAHPRTDLRHQRGDLERRPFLAVQLAPDDVLQIAVPERLGLPDQHFVVVREVAAALDDSRERLDRVIEMDERLTQSRIRWIEVTGGPFAVDAFDLVGDRR